MPARCSASERRRRACRGPSSRPTPAGSRRPTRSRSCGTGRPRSSASWVGSRCWSRGLRHRSTPVSTPRSACGSPTGRTGARGVIGRPPRRVFSVPATGTPASSPGSVSEPKASGRRFCRPDRGARPDPAGSALRHGVRHLPALDQRSTGRRHGSRPRMDVLPAPAAIPRLRRDAPGPGGSERLEVTLGNGWYRGRFGYISERALYGDRLATLAQLKMTTPTVPYTSWQPTRRGGRRERHPGRRHLRRTDDGSAAPRPPGDRAEVEMVVADLGRLVAPEGPPIRPTEVVPARPVWTSPSRKDDRRLRAEPVGWVCLLARGRAAGTEVVIRHAEVLENGASAIGPLRRRGHRYDTSCPARREKSWSRRSRSTGSATPIRDSPALRRKTSSRWSSTPTFPGLAGSPRRTSC